MEVLEGNILTVFLLLLAVIVVLSFPGEDRRMIHPMTNELAVEPDRMIVKAMNYLSDNQEVNSIKYVEKAIESMRVLEKDADEKSNLIIEAAISDLKLLEKELEARQSDENRISHAFLNALNSLTVAQLRESESYIEEKNYAASKVAMDYAMQHLECALKFSNSRERVKELELQESIHKIALQKSISDANTIAQIDKIINEMDAIVLH